MNWATRAIEELKNGNTVSLHPKGHSMSGRIESGDLVTLAPVVDTMLLFSVGDMVLCKVKGRVYLHQIKAIRGGRGQAAPSHFPVQYQIGNNRGGINGWISRSAIYGLVIKVESA